MKKNLIYIILLLIVGMVSNGYGMDTDLYVASATDIPPNVLIILDNSGSMNNEISGVVYEPSFEYPHVISDYPNASYYKTKKGWTIWKNPYTSINCAAIVTALSTAGHYQGKVYLSSSNCGGDNQELATGNYINYLNATGGSGNQPRFGLATAVIKSYINTTDNVRFGLMIFNFKDGGKIAYPINNTWETAHRTAILNAMAGLKAETWTPLAETLYEAGLYFQGNISQQTSYFNPGVTYGGTGGTYPSPIQYYCQKNYIILITDGEPTQDVNDLDSNPLYPNNPIKNVIGDHDKDGNETTRVYPDNGSDYLDDVADYLNKDIDLSPDVVDKQRKQNITTYTVGFTINSPLLQDTATNGGGKYFYAHNSQSFVIALRSIIADILEKSTSYVAPVVPISQMESMSSGNRMYLAMFKPTMKSFWKGNIKKYGIATVASADISVGSILDASGALAMEPLKDSDGKVYGVKIKDEAQSYWSSSPDGEETDMGGVGELLLDRTSPRKIYTYLESELKTNLTDSSNAFTLSNSLITPSLLGLDVSDSTGRDKIINFIHGLDAYDENGNGITTSEKRDWILGAIIHSRPFVVHYADRSVIYAGANDGMFHAFDDASGEELWAYIPPNLLPKLKNLNGDALEFFVDGAPKVYIEKNASGGIEKAILIFGERRGGNYYMALDIKDPVAPKWLWEIKPSSTGYGELGQTWSNPQLGKIKLESGDKWVAFVGGGYDENQDNVPVAASDTKGRAVYVIDVLNGSLVRRFSFSDTGYSGMTHSIPSDITRVDTTNDGKIDRLYVGDTGGQVWRFNIGDPDPTKWTGKNIFKSNGGSSDQRKMFYPPDVTLESDSGYYEMLFIGTGDRENPKGTNVVDRLYAIKDKNPSTPLTENDLVDVTSDTLQDPNATQSQKDTILYNLNVKDGWYIKLENAGEKCLANALVFAGAAYYSTFSPTEPDTTDKCFIAEGTGRLYAVNYKTGTAVFNLDLTNDIAGPVISKTDRTILAGTAIPSGVIVTIIKGQSTAYIGVGGGVIIPPLPTFQSLFPLSWRVVF
jgi:type IV pilus assembly protein PilY1